MADQEKLDLSAFIKALGTLKRALDEYEKDETNEFVRDACIQRFEYSYDLATKMIKRHLKLTEADPDFAATANWQTIIRRAHEIDLIPNSWDAWNQIKNERNATSHGYDEDRAIEVVGKLQPIYNEFDYMLGKLREQHEA